MWFKVLWMSSTTILLDYLFSPESNVKIIFWHLAAECMAYTNVSKSHVNARCLSHWNLLAICSKCPRCWVLSHKLCQSLRERGAWPSVLARAGSRGVTAIAKCYHVGSKLQGSEGTRATRSPPSMGLGSVAASRSKSQEVSVDPAAEDWRLCCWRAWLVFLPPTPVPCCCFCACVSWSQCFSESPWASGGGRRGCYVPAAPEQHCIAVCGQGSICVSYSLSWLVRRKKAEC